MSRHAGILIQRLIATVLVVSVSICCCQAQVLLHAPSDAALAASCGAPGATPSCCTTPANDAPDDAPAGDGCQSCCLKGTGLKDAKPVLPDALPVVTPTLAAVPTFAALPVDVTTLGATDVARRPHVPPTTLVRLHCALLV